MKPDADLRRRFPRSMSRQAQLLNLLQDLQDEPHMIHICNTRGIRYTPTR
jgi:hypothetical protein